MRRVNERWRQPFNYSEQLKCRFGFIKNQLFGYPEQLQLVARNL